MAFEPEQPRVAVAGNHQVDVPVTVDVAVTEHAGRALLLTEGSV